MIKKWFIFALVFLQFMSFGCAATDSKETKIKCPRCGANFTVDAAVQAIGP